MFHSPGQINPESELNPALNKPVRKKSVPDANQTRIDVLLGAIIQLKDLAAVNTALEGLGITAFRLSSTGGFLGQRNITLIMGIPAGQLSRVVETIRLHCHERTEYMTTPLEGVTLPIPLATPVPVGGATLFSVPVEKFEEF